MTLPISCHQPYVLCLLHCNPHLVTASKTLQEVGIHDPDLMDQFIFRESLMQCRCVEEATSYVEIRNYTVSRHPISCLPILPRICADWRIPPQQDPARYSVEQHPLTYDELHNFAHEKVRIDSAIHHLIVTSLTVQGAFCPASDSLAGGATMSTHEDAGKPVSKLRLMWAMPIISLTY